MGDDVEMVSDSPPRHHIDVDSLRTPTGVRRLVKINFQNQ